MGIAKVHFMKFTLQIIVVTAFSTKRAVTTLSQFITNIEKIKPKRTT